MRPVTLPAMLVRGVALAVTLAALQPAMAAAQAALAPDTVRTVVGPQYQKGWFHRLLLGSGYRETWTTPVHVPVLDLDRTAGGLTATRRGGGTQTKSIRFRGEDGKQYVFRLVVKDPTSVLPEELRGTLVENLVADQMSAAHPVGALVVAPILDAVNVLHAQPKFVILPDSPRLGEFRAAFAGLPGLFEERPRDDDDPDLSFAGALKIVSTTEVRRALENDPDVRIDAVAFLDARLIDVFLGDWDRHQDQWRWALVATDSTERWLPIPRDRDQAFTQFDGLALEAGRAMAPQLVKFGPKYSRIVGATWNGRDIDREFLTSLPRQEWISQARALQAVLIDDVLQAAVAALPPEWQAVEGEWLGASLKARRDGLPEMAEVYYRLLAQEVDVWATDADEVAIARTDESAATTVTVARRSTPDQPWYRRTFLPEETQEVRVYLRGGRDSAVAIHAARQRMTIRFIGGDNHDELVTDDAHRVHFYDTGDRTTAGRAKLDTRPYQARERSGDPTSLPYRDWGARTLKVWSVGVSPEAGFLLGLSSERISYAFRHRPYGSSVRWHLTAALGSLDGRAGLDARWYDENSSRYLQLGAQVSGLEILGWYGLGNESTRDSRQDDEYYRATVRQGRLTLSVGGQLATHLEAQIGPVAVLSVTTIGDGPNEDRFISVDDPYGAGTFGQVGLAGTLRFDSRDVAASARRGALVELDGAVYPGWLDLDQGFARLNGRAATYLSLEMPTRPVLALLAGGATTFGAGTRIPFQDVAFLGSRTTLRGWRPGRFAGQHSAYGSAELRLQLASGTLLVPGRQGVFGFGDIGRVWLDGEKSDRWHSSTGIGVWLGAITQGGVLSAALARSDEGSLGYLQLGFAW